MSDQTLLAHAPTTAVTLIEWYVANQTENGADAVLQNILTALEDSPVDLPTKALVRYLVHRKCWPHNDPRAAPLLDRLFGVAVPAPPAAEYRAKTDEMIQVWFDYTMPAVADPPKARLTKS